MDFQTDGKDWSRQPASDASWAAYGAAAWSFTFGVMHALWAAGWYFGLREAQARQAFQKTGFLIYDLVITGVCGLGVVVAVELARRTSVQRARRLIGVLAWTGTGLLTLRGAGAIVQTLYLLALRRYVFDPMHLYTLWFCLGAVLFGVSAWRFQHISDAEDHESS